MPRVTSPTGVTVNVSDEKAGQLMSIGYSSADDASTQSAKKAPAKKAASSKSEK